MKPEEISTKRLRMRRAQDGDEEYLYAYTKDPECSRFLTRLPHSHIEQTKSFLTQWCDNAWDEGSNNFSWVVSLSPKNEAIGLFIVILENHMAQVHFGIRREFWHQGYASEMLKIASDWLLSFNDLQRIWTICDLENISSSKALEKSGFIKEGVLRKRLVLPAFGESPRDCYIYSKIK